MGNGKKSDWDFDWRETGRYDAEMWRAYYNHQFWRLFWLLIKLIKAQLGYSWPRTIRMAYYAGWAAADYRIHRHKGTNNRRILNNLTRSYRLMSERYLFPFDYRKAAELELNWWEIHRRSRANNPELEKALAESAAVVYGVSPISLKEYAHYRAEAMFLPAHEGDKRRGYEIDWAAVERLTMKAWHALWVAVQQHRV